MRPTARTVAAAAVLAGLAGLPGAAGATSEFDRAALARLASPPLGLPPVVLPDGAAPSAAAVALGRKLFFDRRLSHNGTMSCGMCHVPEQGFTNNELATPIGTEGRSLRRNAPTMLNVAYAASLFHDGRETALETQVISPLLARDEMANPSIGYVVARVAALPDYRGLFEAAYGGGPTIGRMGDALAAWQRSLLAGDSRFDRWRYGGEADALDARERRGYELFVGAAGCSGCHTVGERHALFSDGAFHNTGVGYRRAVVRAPSRAPVPVEIAPGVVVALDRAAVESVGDPPQADLGRHEVTLDPADLWRYRTPSLRNVALTAPYMHDGSLRTLEEVVRHYDRGGAPDPRLDPRLRPLGLSAPDIDALVAFLEALTSADVDALVADARSVAVGN